MSFVTPFHTYTVHSARVSVACSVELAIIMRVEYE